MSEKGGGAQDYKHFFCRNIKKLRKEKGLSQIQLGTLMVVNHSTVASWESGLRLPDAVMITRLARVLEVDVRKLLSAAASSEDSLNIIIVDDNKAVLSDSLFILEEVMPNATI
ncbi:MAG: helix-turn-helix domain-containing protein, partial [Oribacterium sp.]|nr:helix-turn-helix domain-containing protein [Oribacterium sp.]